MSKNYKKIANSNSKKQKQMQKGGNSELICPSDLTSTNSSNDIGIKLIYEYITKGKIDSIDTNEINGESDKMYSFGMIEQIPKLFENDDNAHNRAVQFVQSLHENKHNSISLRDIHTKIGELIKLEMEEIEGIEEIEGMEDMEDMEETSKNNEQLIGNSKKLIHDCSQMINEHTNIIITIAREVRSDENTKYMEYIKNGINNMKEKFDEQNAIEKINGILNEIMEKYVKITNIPKNHIHIYILYELIHAADQRLRSAISYKRNIQENYYTLNFLYNEFQEQIKIYDENENTIFGSPPGPRTGFSHANQEQKRNYGDVSYGYAHMKRNILDDRVGGSSKKSSKKPTKKSSKKSSKKPAKKSSKTMKGGSKKSSKKSSKKPTKKSTKKSSKNPTKKSSKTMKGGSKKSVKSTKKSSKKPTKKSTKSTKSPSKKSTKKPSKIPTKKSTGKSTKKSTGKSYKK